MKKTDMHIHTRVYDIPKTTAFLDYLKEKEIETKIHYPEPPHLAEAYASLGYHEGDFPITESMANRVLSLPIYNNMTDEEVDYVIEMLNQY